MRQPRTPGGISQGVEPIACDADRLEMVVHRNEPAAWQAKGFQSDVVGVGAPSGGYDDLIYLNGLAVESCGDGPARHRAGYRRQLCLKVNRDGLCFAVTARLARGRRVRSWEAGCSHVSVTAVYVRSDGAQLDRLTALLDSHRLSMPNPRSCSLDQAAYALAQVVAGHESSGVVITKDISQSCHHTPKKTSHHQGVSR